MRIFSGNRDSKEFDIIANKYGIYVNPRTRRTVPEINNYKIVDWSGKINNEEFENGVDIDIITPFKDYEAFCTASYKIGFDPIPILQRDFGVSCLAGSNDTFPLLKPYEPTFFVVCREGYVELRLYINKRFYTASELDAV